MICYESVIAYGVMTSYVNIIGDETIRTRKCFGKITNDIIQFCSEISALS